MAKPFVSAHFASKEKFKKGLVFNQIPGLPPLEKCKFCDLFILFLLSRKAIILSTTSLNSFSRPICLKRKVGEMSNF